MPRPRTGLLTGIIASILTGATIACGGDSPLDVVPTSTAAPTQIVVPTQVTEVSPTAEVAPTQAPGTGATGATGGAAGGEETYTVQPGDTLGAIAVQFGVTVDALIQANSITDPNVILPGETLIIPAAQ